jgi:hypothetical protein
LDSRNSFLESKLSNGKKVEWDLSLITITMRWSAAKLSEE